MKANELRIGNWVKWNYEESSDGNAYPVEFGYELDDIKNNPNIVKPIPLSKEWLKRFNWNPPKDIGVSFSLTTDEIHFVAGNYYKKIEHVHQLQNLYFALTGEELNQNKEDE
ncbi:hypothetical protein OAA15_00435 [bacterium]|nr:hypothetical protein [bacterium]